MSQFRVGAVVVPNTRRAPFQPYVEKEPNASSGVMNSFQSISFQWEYQDFSHEELRLADYEYEGKLKNGVKHNSQPSIFSPAAATSSRPNIVVKLPPTAPAQGFNTPTQTNASTGFIDFEEHIDQFSFDQAKHEFLATCNTHWDQAYQKSKTTIEQLQQEMDQKVKDVTYKSEREKYTAIANAQNSMEQTLTSERAKMVAGETRKQVLASLTKGEFREMIQTNATIRKLFVDTMEKSIEEKTVELKNELWAHQESRLSEAVKRAAAETTSIIDAKHTLRFAADGIQLNLLRAKWDVVETAAKDNPWDFVSDVWAKAKLAQPSTESSVQPATGTVSSPFAAFNAKYSNSSVQPTANVTTSQFALPKVNTPTGSGKEGQSLMTTWPPNPFLSPFSPTALANSKEAPPTSKVATPAVYKPVFPFPPQATQKENKPPVFNPFANVKPTTFNPFPNKPTPATATLTPFNPFPKTTPVPAMPTAFNPFAASTPAHKRGAPASGGFFGAPSGGSWLTASLPASSTKRSPFEDNVFSKSLNSGSSETPEAKGELGVNDASGDEEDL